MILLNLKNYIRQHHKVSLENIKNHFGLTDDAAQGLLFPLIKQGHIVEIPAGSCNSGLCSSNCQSNQSEYQWIERKLRPLPISIKIETVSAR